MLRDLASFLEDDGLDYPLPATAFGDETTFPNGKTYHVPSPDAKTGLWLTGLADLAVKATVGDDELTGDEMSTLKLDDEQETNLYQRVLGPAYDEMLADRVKWSTLQRVGRDAYLCFAMSQQAADLVLAGQGEAMARANRASRRAAKKTAGRKSSQASTGTANRTRRRASTATSTSPSGSEAAAAI